VKDVKNTASAERQHLVYGGIRTALIGYGIAALTLISARSDSVIDSANSGTSLVLWGLAVQVALMLARFAIKYRIPNAADAARYSLVVELLGDGASVLLFAIGTFSAIAGTLGGL
jgi:hypothetical protein